MAGRAAADRRRRRLGQGGAAGAGGWAGGSLVAGSWAATVLLFSVLSGNAGLRPTNFSSLFFSNVFRQHNESGRKIARRHR
jgi:hypothetical protein